MAQAKRKQESVTLDLALQPRQEDLYRLIEATGRDVPTWLGYGGARGGGKSAAIRRCMIARRFTHPGTVGFIVRRLFRDLAENHIAKFQLEYPDLNQYYRSQDKEYRFPNGSRIVFRYAENLDEVRSGFRGMEAMDIFVDQAEQFSEEELLMIKTANRWPNAQAGQCKLALFFNPGGIGTEFLRRVFYIKQYREAERPSDFVFLQAYGWENYEWFRGEVDITEKDFYALPNDDRFELFINHTSEGRKMNALPPSLRVGELLGSFESFSGQYFAGVWDESKCILTMSETARLIQPWWTRWMATDWGFAHYAAHGWCASGKVGPREFREVFGGDTEWPVEVAVVYRELAANETAEEDLGRMIAEMTPEDEKRMIRTEFLGPDAFAKKGSANTVAEQLQDVFRRNGLPAPELADNDRIGGWRFLYSGFKQACSLRGAHVTKEMATAGPMILVSANCPQIISSIPMLIRDEKNTEDVKKMPTMADDIGDMVRYLIKSMLSPRSTAPREVRAQEVMDKYESMTSKAMAMLQFNAKEAQHRPGFARRMRVR